MENAKIILEDGSEKDVNGIFYIFDSKYYFIYTQGEFVDNDYVQLYIVQVCKEVQNTPNGQTDTGNMLGLEINDKDEWGKVQSSITEIVNDKKNGTTSSEIQYLPITMLSKLKIVSKNKFKLMKHIIEENFKVQLSNESLPQDVLPEQQTSDNNTSNEGEVIIDYRTKFFEEQEKNKELKEQIKTLQGKLDSIKGVLG